MDEMPQKSKAKDTPASDGYALSFDQHKYLIIRKFARGLIDLKETFKQSTILTPAQQRQLLEVVQNELISSTSYALNVAEHYIQKDVFGVDQTRRKATVIPAETPEKDYILYLDKSNEVKQILREIAQKRCKICEYQRALYIAYEYRKYYTAQKSDNEIMDLITQFKNVYLRIASIKELIRRDQPKIAIDEL